MLAVQVIVTLDLYHINYSVFGNSNHHYVYAYCWGETKNFESFLSLIVGYISISLHRRGGRSVRG